MKECPAKTDRRDVAIIGAGAAGFGAAIYAARYGLKTVVLGEMIGGTATMAHLVENYPGVKSISGVDLMNTFREQAESFGTQTVLHKITNIGRDGSGFCVFMNEPNEGLHTRTLILATGSRRRKLNIPGEKEFIGKGVSYCATCDGPFFRGKTVAVIGGGDSAVTAALMLGEYAQKVYLIHRREDFTAEDAWVKKFLAHPRCEAIRETNVIAIEGEQTVKRVILDRPRQRAKQLAVEGVFIEIGAVPESNLAQELGVDIEKDGRIIVNDAMETSVSGIFAAGDVTTGSNRYDQLVTAMAEGANAAHSAYRWLAHHHGH